MEGIITPIIENFLKAQQEKRAEERGTKKTYFYASDSLIEDINNSKCMRQIGYEFSDIEPEPLDVPTLKKFAIGNALHDWLQDLLIKTKNAKIIEECNIIYLPDGAVKKEADENNKIIIKDPEIHGRLDVLLIDDTIVEIKTINSGGFFYLGRAPKPGHYLQIQLYLHQKNLKKGVLFYINKETGQTKEFLLRYNPEYVQKALKRFKTLKENFIDKNILPPRPYLMHDYHCNYCAFFKECWKEELSKNVNE